MDTPVTPFDDEKRGAERRREERLAFLRECQVEVRSPNWAVLPSYLMGETRNITLHGVLVALDGFSREMFTRWASHLHSDETLSVVIRFVEGDKRLELPGQITWTMFREDEPDSPEGVCEAGVLLSLLDPETEQALRQLILELAQ
jgi:hypothetical protein